MQAYGGINKDEIINTQKDQNNDEIQFNWEELTIGMIGSKVLDLLQGRKMVYNV